MAAAAENTAVTETAPPLNRTEAIAAALETTEKEMGGGDETTTIEEKTKEPVVEKKEESTADADAALAAQGLDLIKALNDPARREIVVKFLAESAGYTKGVTATTKEEAKEINDEITSALKESLGADFEFLADKLAPALKKILSSEVAKSQADIRAEFQKQQEQKLQAESSAAISKMTESFFGQGEDLPDNVSKEMSRYMDRVPPTADMSVKDYIEDAFNVAIGKLGIVKTDKGKEARTNKNRVDAPSRLQGASERVSSEENIRKENTKPMTRQEAIRAAIAAAEKEQ